MTAEIDLDVGAQLSAGIGRIAEQVQHLAGLADRERAWRAELNGKIMPLNIDPIPIPAGGYLEVPRLLGPPMGWTWQIDVIGFQGFTAGTVIAYVNSVLGVQLYTSSGPTVIYQTRLRVMRYGEQLVFQASGIVGAAAAVWLSGFAFTDDIQGEVFI